LWVAVAMVALAAPMLLAAGAQVDTGTVLLCQ
jgi:hypothetical protein